MTAKRQQSQSAQEALPGGSFGMIVDAVRASGGNLGQAYWMAKDAYGIRMILPHHAVARDTVDALVATGHGAR